MTYHEILEGMEARYLELAGHRAEDAGDVGIRLKLLAQQLEELHSRAETLWTQAFPQTAEGEALDYHAGARGIIRKAAAPSWGKLLFQRDTPAVSPIAIPKGTVCQTAEIGGLRFETTEEAVLQEGETSVLIPASSLEGGRDKNVGAGTIRFFVHIIQGLASVTNPEIFLDGADAETDTALRERLMASYRNLSNGANAAFYYQAAMEQEGIYSVKVIPRAQGLGSVEVVVAGQGFPASAAVVESLQAYFEECKEIAVNVLVTPAEGREIPIEVQIRPAQEELYGEAAAAMTARIEDFFLRRRVGESLYLSQLYQELHGVEGVENFLILEPETDITPRERELLTVREPVVRRLGGEE